MQQAVNLNDRIVMMPLSSSSTSFAGEGEETNETAPGPQRDDFSMIRIYFR
jgi:hypothetical protein